MTANYKRITPLFPEGKKKVLTMSYDDGMIEDRRLVSVFNQHGIRGTFHLNSALMQDERRVSPEEAKTLYVGHEIATHAHTHPHLEEMPLLGILQEITLDRLSLEAITGAPVRGHSYPYGSYSADVMRILADLGIRYARTTKATHDIWKLPENFLAWHPTCHHADAKLFELLDMFLAPTPAYADFACLYVWGHSYEFERANNWELIEEFCRRAGGHDEVWYATNIEIVDYMEAYRRLRFTADLSVCENPSCLPVFLCIDKTHTVMVDAGKTVALY